ncbi:MAG: transporter substrate-binding domain-containing protein [Spirochaetales bacterium]|nr:transporter substrate-binding domain-containing protein [Spirochaetales bacterium]
MFNSLIKKSILILCICFASVGVVGANQFAGETWRITSLDWQPYSGSDMATLGNSIQKLKGLLAKEGITLEVDFFPWLRSQQLAKTEKYIGYFPAWPEEVADGFVASLPVDWSEIGILKQTGKSISYKDMDDLFKNYKVGIVSTYEYPKEIADAMKKYPKNVDESPDEVSLLKKLSAGRFQVAITDPNVMMYLASREGISNIEVLVQVVVKKELVIALRNDPDNQARIEFLKKLLKQ